ncbi:unnamed protein product [Caenorhabditis sp. 36 PRJEB53466]|nr:unnamed protein product [Caenorhabditis sp. 36 PRJEB53466]
MLWFSSVPFFVCTLTWSVSGHLIKPSEEQKPINYTGYSLLQFKTHASSNSISKIQKFNVQVNEKTNSVRLLIEIWAKPSFQNPYALVLVAPEFIDKFKSLLTCSETETLKEIERNIQSKIDEEQTAMFRDSIGRQKRSLSTWYDFEVSEYHSYDQMRDFLTLLSEQIPDTVELVQVSTSFEGRIVYGVKIHPLVSPPNKSSIVVDAGVHAREWIAPAVALYLIKTIVLQYGETSNVTDNLNKFDWYIIPQVNPDGYEYSRTQDRLWRKTRSFNSTVSKHCFGSDGNRNWGYRWGEVGATRDPCSYLYQGSHPYSEPEIAGLKQFLTEQVSNPIVYASLHSYGQIFLAPWGHTNNKTANHDDLIDAVSEAVAAINATTGSVYIYGTISEMMYPSAGSSIDFMQHRGVPYVYGIELPPTNEVNNFAFNLPPNRIKETGDEILAALHAIADHAVKVKNL